jgi:hypothetical protein
MSEPKCVVMDLEAVNEYGYPCRKFIVDINMEIPKGIMSKSFWDCTVSELAQMYKEYYRDCNE